MPVSFVSYGEDRFRLFEHSEGLQLVSGVIVATSKDGPIIVVDPKTGERRASDVVDGAVVGARRVLAASRSRPNVLCEYQLPGLGLESAKELSAKILVIAEHSDRCAVSLEGDIIALIEGEAQQTLSVAGVKVLRFSPDGLRLAVGTESGKVLVVDAKTGAILSTLTGARSPISNIVWSDDGSLLAASSNTSALVWPSAGGKSTNVFKAKYWAQVIGFYGHHLVVGSMREKCALIDVKTKKIIWEHRLYGDVILRGRRVIAAHFEDIAGLDVETGKITRGIIGPHIHLKSLEVDGETIFVTTSQGARLLVGDLSTGEWQPMPAGHESRSPCIQFVGDRILTGEHGSSAILWRRGETTPLMTFHPPTKDRGRVEAVLLDGDEVYAGMSWGLHCYQASTGKYLRGYQAQSDIQVIAAVGDVLLVCTEAHRSRRGEIILLNKSDLSLLHSEKTYTTYRKATVTGERVRLDFTEGWREYDTATRQITREEISPNGLFGHRRLSPDGKILIEYQSTRDQVNERWRYSLRGAEAASGAEIFLKDDLVSAVWQIDFHPSSQYFAATHFDRHVRVWSSKEGALLHELPLFARADDVYWHPDGESLFVSCNNGELREYRL